MTAPHDTAPIRTEESFDETRVSAYLREHLGGLFGDGPIEYEQFPGGAANLTYLARSADTELVLRRAPLGEVARGGHDMEREHRVLSRLWEAFPKAPRAYLYCEDPDVMGKPFFVMERCRGYVIRSTWPPGVGEDPDARRKVAVSLVDTLADLHAVDPDAVGLGTLGRPEGFVARQVEGWSRRWEAARTRTVPEMDRAAAHLAAHEPEPHGVTMLHNDYKLDNTMVDESGAIIAVFDWDMSTRGDPLVDLGTLLAYWPDPGSATYPVFAERAVALVPYLSKREALERYATATDRDVSDVRYYEGLALFRIAVIIEQIYARYVSGQTSDPRFARFEPVAPLLAASALETLESGAA
jgi:aminoglycoside phosphotransferase (APT) family kinase protein